MQPATVQIDQAWRDGQNLIIGLDGGGGEVKLTLANLPTIRQLTGLPAEAWSYRNGVLTLPAIGKTVLRISP